VILVAAAVVLATSLGVVCEHRTPAAERFARGSLGAMLYLLVPFVAYVSFARLSLTVDAGIGLLLAYAGIGATGLLAWLLGRRVAADRGSLGAIVCTTVIVNSGYLGLPITTAALGSAGLAYAVVYDQVVSAPVTFTVGFALGAVFGTRRAPSWGGRIRALLTRNPPLAAAIVGLLVPAAWAPQALVSASHLIVDALLPVGFFAVGVYLSSERREDAAPLLERPDLPTLLSIALRAGVTPAVLLLGTAAGIAIPAAYLIQAAMPAGINSLIVAHAFGLNQRLVAGIIVWGTLLTLAVALVAGLV